MLVEPCSAPKHTLFHVYIHIGQVQGDLSPAKNRFTGMSEGMPKMRKCLSPVINDCAVCPEGVTCCWSSHCYHCCSYATAESSLWSYEKSSTKLQCTSFTRMRKPDHKQSGRPVVFVMLCVSHLKVVVCGLICLNLVALFV